MTKLTSKKNIVLVGPPNSGKTSLFNWLTGFKHRVINYPRSTVSLSVGNTLEKYNILATVTDSPGIYSLFPKSQDEQVTKDFLFKDKKVDAIILVLDANKLEVQLPLFFQLQEAGFPLLIALTMWDLFPNASINIESLKNSLNTSVIPIKGLIGDGVENLLTSLKNLQKATRVQELKVWDEKKINKILKTSQQIVKTSLTKNQPNKKENIFYSHKLDKFFLHPKIGLVLFAGIMFSLFSSLFWLAAPFMDVIDSFFSFLITKSLTTFAAYPYIADFLSYGLIASFGSVLVFIPQIFILFIGISLLEDTGYLARAVALMDGPLSQIGLSGRSFVPFLSGYACAIPSIIATRSLDSKREKIMTLFSIPFMTCSAKLPVFALLLSFLFYGQSSWKPGLILSLIYLASFFLGMLAVFILNLFLKKETKPAFLLDLPIYRKPVVTKVLKNSIKRTKHYIVKAGPAIFTVALIIWVITNFPSHPELSLGERMNHSYAGLLGQWAEPLFSTMGVDWRVGIALIAAFAAREVFVSALVLVFTITEVSNEHLTSSLIKTMQTASNSEGHLIFTTASVMALIVFFMISLQCLSTTAILYKESRSLKLALSQLISLNVLAYIMAVLVYQTLNFLL